MGNSGRPRDQRVDQAITVATRELLVEAGYAGLTMDSVAARAGIGKAAIYRRYSSKQEMVFAAAVHGHDLQAPPDNGSLLADLTGLANVIVGHLSNPAARVALPALIGEIATSPQLAERFTRTFIEPEQVGNTEILRRAVRRGELDRMPDIDLFHAMFGGTIFSWLFIVRHDPHGIPDRLARFTCDALQAHLNQVRDRPPAPTA